MISIIIEDSKLESIFIDGFSGSMPRAHKLNGSGLGMELIKKAVSLNDGMFHVIPGEKNEIAENGLIYANNCFKITLNS